MNYADDSAITGRNVMETETKSDMSYIERTSGLKTKDYVGYAMGDFSCVLLFGLVTAILQVYYTDVLHIEPWWIIWMFLGSRIWDAVNDPIMGRIVDTAKIGKEGRYRPWLVRLCIPLSCSAILMFVKFPGFGDPGHEAGTFAYVTITYVIFTMLYTGVNIPYGSLASVLTTNEKERNTLSIWRNIGSSLGGLPAILLSGLCFKTVIDSTTGKEAQVMDYNAVMIGVTVLAVLSALFCFICFKGTKERVISKSRPKRQKGENMRTIKNLLKSRPFVAICVAGMALLASETFIQSYYVYLFKNYFNKPELYILVTVSIYAPMIVVMLFLNKIIKTFGKKEICGAGMALACISNFILFFIHTDNVWVFLALCLLTGIGFSFFTLQIWSLVGDAIDYNECRTGIREDATSYAFFTFSRKLGQAISAVFVNLALIWIGYNVDIQIQSEQTMQSMYKMATLIPAIMYLLMCVVMFVFYPLNKKRMHQLQIDKEESLKRLFEENEKAEAEA